MKMRLTFPIQLTIYATFQVKAKLPGTYNVRAYFFAIYTYKKIKILNAHT